MSEKPTVTIPDLHHVEIQTTIHVADRRQGDLRHDDLGI